jgi:hypothetical protein
MSNQEKPHQGKIVRDIHVHNDVFEGTAYKKQNNVLRMILFYTTCILVLVFASYSGLIAEKSNLHDGVLENNAEMLKDGINFEKTNRTLLSQMPGLLDEVKKDPNDKYMASMEIEDNSPKIQIDTDNIQDLLIKGGFLQKTMNGLEFPDMDWKTEGWAYNRVNVVLTIKDNPSLQLTLHIAKDGSILIWRVVGVTLSKALLDRLLA